MLQDCPAAYTVATALRNSLTEFREVVPVIDSLASAALKDWHWLDVSDVIGVTVHPADGLTLQQLITHVRHCTALHCTALCCSDGAYDIVL